MRPLSLLIASAVIGLAACEPTNGRAPEGATSVPERNGPQPAPGPPTAHAIHEHTAAATAGPSEGALVRVSDTDSVCMVNDQYMGRPQIPVEVTGHTYFGCCEMCEARLRNDRAVRFAKDPVTGEEVDKSTAIIARASSNAVFYFASEDSLRRYRPQ